MHKWIMFTLLLALQAGVVKASVSTEGSDAQKLHLLRSSAFELTTNLVVFFNYEYGRAQEPSNQEAYRRALHALNAQRAGLGGTGEELIRKMGVWVDELEKHTNDPGYPATINLNKILEAQSQLDTLLADQYAANKSSLPERQVKLNALSVDLSRMELLYLSFTFRTLIVYVMDNDDEAVRSLDRRIVKQFDDLDSSTPDLAESVSKAHRNYLFVRDRMNGLAKLWLPNSVEYYMHHAVVALDEAAAASR